MANSTQNFKLIKPLQEEFYNVDDFNKNADAVDAALAALDIKKAPSGFGLGTAAIDISGQDLNADRATGFYRGFNLANAPSQGWWYVINMSHSDTGWYYQQAVSYGSGNTANIIFTRTKISGVWSAWKQLATIDGTIANADTVDGKHASAFAPSGFGLGIQNNLFENANLILNTGFYYCTGGLPGGVSDANVYHHAHSDAYAHQMAFEFGPNYSNIIYSRIKNNGTWLAWRQIATTDIVLPLTGGTLSGPLIANGGVFGDLTGNATTASDITAGFSDNSLAFPINNFRTTIFGSSNGGTHAKPFRVIDVLGIAHGSGFAWGMGDTHGFIHTQYNDGKTFIGGGNGDVINWYKQIATTDAVLPLAGGTLKGNLTVPTIYTGNWFRSTGNTGWYSETYDGGWHMSDDTWIRAYNGKNVFTTGVFQADGGFNGLLHGTAELANLLNPLSGDTNFKLGYTADGQITNKGEWGRVVMHHSNGQTYGVRVDRADNADNSNTVGGAILSQLTRADVSQNMSEGISHRYLKKGGYMLVGGIRTDGGDVSCVTTDGTNLVLDSRNAGDIYLGYYGGKNVIFCGGSNTIKSHVDANGVFQGTASYATTAGNANAVNGHVFNWSGQDGQPTWLWGGNDASNMYIYNPSNFNVNSVGGYTAAQLIANSGGIVAQSLGANGYVKFSSGFIIQWGLATSYAYTAFPITFPSVLVQLVMTGSVGYDTTNAGVTITDANISDSGKPANRSYVAFGY